LRTLIAVIQTNPTSVIHISDPAMTSTIDRVSSAGRASRSTIRTYGRG